MQKVSTPTISMKYLHENFTNMCNIFILFKKKIVHPKVRTGGKDDEILDFKFKSYQKFYQHVLSLVGWKAFSVYIKSWLVNSN